MAHDCVGENCACKKMMDYELTDGDLLDVFDTLECDCSEEDIARAAAKAQRKKLLDWLRQECFEHNDALGALDGEDYFPLRFSCSKCLQPLLKAHEDVS